MRCRFSIKIFTAWRRCRTSPFGKIIIGRIRAIAHRRRVNGNRKAPRQFNLGLFTLAPAAPFGNHLRWNVAPIKGNQICHHGAPLKKMRCSKLFFDLKQVFVKNR
jgi:hypothetical protein